MADEAALRNLRGRARAPHPRDAVGSGSIWFGGNVSRYYDSLLAGEKRKLRPQQIETLAVHRWLGARRSTTEHYKLVHSALARLPRAARVMDAGCGVGGAMLWLEQREPAWQLVGHTVSEEQHGWAERVCKQKVPPCRFTVQLRSYDAPMGSFNAIYSIEALIHSPDVGATLQAWSRHLEPGGAVAVIDDFLADHPPPTVLREPEIARALAAFRSGWLAVGLCSPARLAAAAAAAGLRLVENRNIGEEYQVVARNYRSLAPKLPNESEWKSHQGWFGSIARRILTVRGVVEYRLLVLAKVGAVPLPSRRRLGQIESRHMSGVGRSGGSRMACISPWYCCGQGVKLWDEMNATRTDSLSFLRLPRAIFGNYMEVFAERLSRFYEARPAAAGRFLDIGGTGSTVSGMRQVQTKFKHFAGDLEYWVLDVDLAARSVRNSIVCDIEDCPAASDASFDVTFSHTVLEHVRHPWKAFDTIARVTKPGGLTLHLVPWSYQWHATPADYYRFSHQALQALMEERGFAVEAIGIDVCTRPQRMARRKDEHFPTIQLTYVVGRKV